MNSQDVLGRHIAFKRFVPAKDTTPSHIDDCLAFIVGVEPQVGKPPLLQLAFFDPNRMSSLKGSDWRQVFDRAISVPNISQTTNGTGWDDDELVHLGEVEPAGLTAEPDQQYALIDGVPYIPEKPVVVGAPIHPNPVIDQPVSGAPAFPGGPVPERPITPAEAEANRNATAAAVATERTAERAREKAAAPAKAAGK